MSETLARHWHENRLRDLTKLKGLADKALAQVDDAAFLATSHADGNSLAVHVKHLAGNMRSRWTEFLTTDGEKPDRNRDGEFVIGADDTRASLMQRWEAGWALVFAAIEPLSDEQLLHEVAIRGEPHTVMQAVERQLSHYAYHVGQIVQLARHHCDAGWTSLSIPRGKSAEFDVSKDGTPYLAEPGTTP